MSFLTDFFSQAYQNQYGSSQSPPGSQGADMNGSPFPAPPSYVFDNLGRSSVYNLANSLMTNHSFMGGLANGLQGADQIFGSGIADYRKQMEDQQKQQIDIKAKLLDIRGKQQEQKLNDAREKRDQSAFDTKQKEEPTRFQWEQEDHANSMDEAQRKQDKFDSDQEDVDKADAAAQSAVALGKTSDQKAFFKLLADSGQYDQLWKAVQGVTIPDPNKPHWTEPYTQPGIGLLQRNTTTGEVAVLHHEPREDSKSFHVNPNEVSKEKFNILEKVLIPSYIAEAGNKAVKPEVSGWDNFLISIGAKQAPKVAPETEPMVDYQSGRLGKTYRIPARLLDQAESQATQQYTRTYQNAWNAMNNGGKVETPTAEGGNIHSAGPRGAKVQDFSEKLNLEGAVRSTVTRTLPGVTDSDREAKVKSILKDIQSAIDSGQTTYQEALKKFGGA